MSYMDKPRLAARYTGVAAHIVEGTKRLLSGEEPDIPRGYLRSAISFLELALGGSDTSKRRRSYSLDIVDARTLVIKAGSEAGYNIDISSVPLTEEKIGELLALTTGLGTIQQLTSEQRRNYERLCNFWKKIGEIGSLEAHTERVYGPEKS